MTKAFLSLFGTYFRVFLTWWTMQRWYSVFGNVVGIASFIPVRPSVQIISMSFTPRFFNSFNTDSQYFEISLSPTLIVSTFFQPLALIPRMTYISYKFPDHAIVTKGVLDCVNVEDGVYLFQWAVLPVLDLWEYLVRDPVSSLLP